MLHNYVVVISQIWSPDSDSSVIIIFLSSLWAVLWFGLGPPGGVVCWCSRSGSQSPGPPWSFFLPPASSSLPAGPLTALSPALKPWSSDRSSQRCSASLPPLCTRCPAPFHEEDRRSPRRWVTYLLHLFNRTAALPHSSGISVRGKEPRTVQERASKFAHARTRVNTGEVKAKVPHQQKEATRYFISPRICRFFQNIWASPRIDTHIHSCTRVHSDYA